MMEALQFEFMRNALMAGLLASVLCGVMGTLVVVNRLVFLSGGIAHAAYGGIGMALYLGWPVLPTTVGFSLGASLFMAGVMSGARHRADTLIGVLWAVGMAVGIVFVDLTPGYNTDLMSYLFGSILAVSDTDLWLMALTGVLVCGFVALQYDWILAMSYDEEFARVRRVPVQALRLVFIGLLAVAVVMIMRVVGLILVIALLTIPPFIAERYSTDLVRMMIASSVLSAAFTVSGLALSYVFDLSSGASIILVAAACFWFSLGIDRFRSQRDPSSPV
ncbi:MAG: metal ABC transporter permease [Desulfobacteraceae bacterium]|nr:metal ABC transporter permease [Desulfobacteraceae bacterium]